MKKTIIIFLLIALLIPNASAQAATKSLNTKANLSACKNIKKDYKSETMSKWSNGLASDQDVLEEIDLNIKTLTKKQEITTGKIKTVIFDWIQSERDTKNQLINKNIDGLTSAINSKILSIKNFDKICKSIKK